MGVASPSVCHREATRGPGTAQALEPLHPACVYSARRRRRNKIDGKAYAGVHGEVLVGANADAKAKAKTSVDFK